MVKRRKSGGGMEQHSEATPDAKANEMIARYGRRAMQVTVDQILHALRIGDERTAEQHQRLLRCIEQKLAS